MQDTANDTADASKGLLPQDTTPAPCLSGIALWLHLSEKDFVHSKDIRSACRVLLDRFRFSFKDQKPARPLLFKDAGAARKIFEVNRERELCLELFLRRSDAERIEPLLVNAPPNVITAEAPVYTVLSIRSTTFYHVRVCPRIVQRSRPYLAEHLQSLLSNLPKTTIRD